MMLFCADCVVASDMYLGGVTPRLLDRGLISTREPPGVSLWSAPIIGVGSRGSSSCSSTRFGCGHAWRRGCRPDGTLPAPCYRMPSLLFGWQYQGFAALPALAAAESVRSVLQGRVPSVLP